MLERFLHPLQFDSCYTQASSKVQEPRDRVDCIAEANANGTLFRLYIRGSMTRNNHQNSSTVIAARNSPKSALEFVFYESCDKLLSFLFLCVFLLFSADIFFLGRIFFLGAILFLVGWFLISIFQK